MQDLISFYRDRVSNYSASVTRVEKSLFYTSVARVISFIALGGCLYFFLKSYNTTFVGLAFIMLVLFLWLVKKSSALTFEKQLLDQLVFVNQNELLVIQGFPNQFDNGVYGETNKSYYADLDIFGEGSLFHLLNRTATTHGFQRLEQLLKHSFTSKEEILQFQDAIKSFAPQHSVREQIIAKALINKDAKGNVGEIKAWLEQPSTLVHNKWIEIVRYLIPAASIVLLFLCLYLDNYYLLTLIALISWMHVGYYSKYISRQQVLLGSKQDILNQYTLILEDFEKVDPKESAVLKENVSIASQAHVQVKKLSNLSNLLDQRLNIVVNILLNSFVAYDLQVMLALEKWKELNKKNLSQWIDCVAIIECLTSLSAFAFNNPAYCYPEVVEDDLLIEAKELAHPLINPGERISNDIELGKASRLLLVTGSNMSGKTTFLRTLGVNTLLAQCGAPVCASSFKFRPVHIYTSIRISDSLQEHTSYFMAELKRLSEIKEHLSNQQPSLVLIDEILRGTNSDDKYYGSAQFVKQLTKYNCLTLFATHDLKLSELENEFPGVIENYCFESIIEDDELKFDYKLLKGVAQNKNASFLMKKMNII